MASVVRNLIEYCGIADYLPTNATAFKQFNVQENLCIPALKPDIEQIVKVMAEVYVTNKRVIKTPVATSLEGQNLTGWKLIIEGEVKQKIEYVADEPSQSVHAAHYTIPFSTFIVLPPSYIPGCPVIVTGYIEDIFVEQIGKRSIFKNVTILLDAEFGA